MGWGYYKKYKENTPGIVKRSARTTSTNHQLPPLARTRNRTNVFDEVQRLTR